MAPDPIRAGPPGVLPRGRLRFVGLGPNALKQVASRLHGESGVWHADVTDHEAMTAVAAEVGERFGKVATTRSRTSSAVRAGLSMTAYRTRIAETAIPLSR
jgi:hypothetical protein